MVLGRYYSVNHATKTFLSGPFKVDPEADPTWAPPGGGALLAESAALAGGYSWPPENPDPAYVLRQKIPAAIAANNAFLSIAHPNEPQQLAYLRLVAKELNMLARLVGQVLDDITDA